MYGLIGCVQYYHSLAAQGKDVDDVLDRAEEAEAAGDPIHLALEPVASATAASTTVGADAVNGALRNDESEEGEVNDDVERPPTEQERLEALRRAGLETGLQQQPITEPAPSAGKASLPSEAPNLDAQRPAAGVATQSQPHRQTYCQNVLTS